MQRILVVDDNAQNRTLAEAILLASGYRVTLAASGEEATALFAADAPDLVLLDIMMPELDGFATCRALRALPRGADVAIVFLTALDDLGTHQRAMDSGADDFLTKPIQRTELLMRVRSLLRVKRLQDRKEELSQLLVHDLKTPLSVILGYAQILAEAGELQGDLRDAARAIVDSGSAMQRMLLNLLDIGRSEDGVLVPELRDVDVAVLLETVRAHQASSSTEHGVVLSTHADLPAGARVTCDPDLMRRVLENLVDNAIKYSPQGGSVRIEARPEGDRAVEIRVVDQGRGVPEAFREKVFEKYVRVDPDVALAARNMSRGLGLTFCRLAVQAHGGSIRVTPNTPRGSVFSVRLPAGG